MIHCYCSACGLYIVVKDRFSGGKGSCPRCLSNLRIPKPIERHSGQFVPGLRYIAMPVTENSPETAGDHIGPDWGPSTRYKCTSCHKPFQSLHTSDALNRCPFCDGIGQIEEPDVKFPRYLKKSKSEKPAEISPEKLENPAEETEPDQLTQESPETAENADKNKPILSLKEVIEGEYQLAIKQAEGICENLENKVESLKNDLAENEQKKIEQIDRLVAEKQKYASQLARSNVEIKQLENQQELKQKQMFEMRERFEQQVRQLEDELSRANRRAAAQSDNSDQLVQDEIDKLEAQLVTLREQVRHETEARQAAEMVAEQAMDQAQNRAEDMLIRLQLQNKSLADEARRQRDMYQQLLIENSRLHAELGELGKIVPTLDKLQAISEGDLTSDMQNLGASELINQSEENQSN